MTELPTLEDYLNTTQQNIKKFFVDMELASGVMEYNALGLPRVRSGNFAIIFKVRCAKKLFAVRCFLHMPSDLEDRYEKISSALHSDDIGNSFFSEFSYLKKGIVVNGKTFPVVKMEWIEGLTLGEFVNKNYDNPEILGALKRKVRNLQEFLNEKQIAHGDLQPGNLIISHDGMDIKLIDYDGMFVPTLEGKMASELGHSNFQHPGRTKEIFHSHLDWFSFIQLDASLTFLIENASLWNLTYSDEEGILFRAVDLINPQESRIFHEISKQTAYATKLDSFAEICSCDFTSIPSPNEFYAETFKPKKIYHYTPGRKRLKPTTHTEDKSNPYLSDYDIVDGNEFVEFTESIGKRLEIIGRVIDVREGKSQFGYDRRLRPYIYLDMDELKKGELFRIKFLPDIVEGAILSGSALPNKKWIGKWVTVTETIQPKNILNHPSFPHGISEIFVIVKNLNQVKVLSQSEALYRLGGNKSNLPVLEKPVSSAEKEVNNLGNQDIIKAIKNL